MDDRDQLQFKILFPFRIWCSKSYEIAPRDNTPALLYDHVQCLEYRGFAYPASAFPVPYSPATLYQRPRLHLSTHYTRDLLIQEELMW